MCVLLLWAPLVATAGSASKSWSGRTPGEVRGAAVSVPLRPPQVGRRQRVLHGGHAAPARIPGCRRGGNSTGLNPRSRCGGCRRGALRLSVPLRLASSSSCPPFFAPTSVWTCARRSHDSRDAWLVSSRAPAFTFAWLPALRRAVYARGGTGVRRGREQQQEQEEDAPDHTVLLPVANTPSTRRTPGVSAGVVTQRRKRRMGCTRPE